jgi:hypothetical protein
VDSLRATSTKPWYTSSDTACKRSLRSDGYHLTNVGTTVACNTWVSFIPRLSDARIAVDVAFRQVDRPSFAGLTCRQGPGYGYRALISTSGYVRITKIGSPSDLILRQERWTRSPSGTHRLELTCKDQAGGSTRLSLIVDGLRAVETLDKQRLPTGYVGMYASGLRGRSGVTEAVFTNVSVTACGEFETTCD